MAALPLILSPSLFHSLSQSLSLSSSLFLFCSLSLPHSHILSHRIGVEYIEIEKWLRKWYLQNSTKTNSFSLIVDWKFACVSTKTPFSTLGFESVSHRTKPDNANMHVATVNKNILPPVFLDENNMTKMMNWWNKLNILGRNAKKNQTLI